MFRRRFRFQRNPIKADQLATFVKANQLVSEGKTSQAAPLLASLAQAMQQGGQPRNAANLFARAAHAYTDADNEQAALASARSALALFTEYKMVNRTPVFFANITRRMAAKGMPAAAEALQKEFGAQIPAQGSGSQPIRPHTHGLLPTACPKCGAPVLSDEVEWVDDNTAACAYCGGLMRVDDALPLS